MRGRILFVVGALAGCLGSALGATAGSGAAAAPGSSGHMTAAVAGDAAQARAPRYTARDLRSPASWRAARERVLRARLATMPRSSGSTVVVAAYFLDDALPIGDVDHDGFSDVLSVRIEARTPAVVVMSGRTGKVLWSRPDPAAYAAVYVSAPGMTSTVMTLSSTDTGADAVVAGGFEDVFTVAAYRADHGTSLWSTSINGIFEGDLTGFRAAGIGEFDGVLDRAGAAPYLLLDRFSEGDPLVADGSSIVPEVIDATTGTTVSAGPTLASEWYAWAFPVDDLNGDGADDYVLASSDAPAAIEAVSSVNGAPLWAMPLTSTNGAASLGLVRGSPDLTGDHKPDLLVSWFDDAAEHVSAWSGATGATVWTHDGEVGSPLGDIDRDGRSDTRIVTFGLNSITYAAVTATGRTAWSHEVRSPADRAVVSASYPVGDLNGDGAVDTYLRYVKQGKTVSFGVTSSVTVAVYLIDGRTGKQRTVHDMGLPVGDSLSGRAMTFVQTVPAKHGVRVIAFNGATTRAYWQTSLSSADMDGAIDVSVLPMTGGRRGIVGLMSGRANETVVLLDGRRGARQWSVAYPTRIGDGFFV